MKLTTKKLLQELLETTKKNISVVEKLMNQPVEMLNWKQNPESWSALECIEHLNKYGDFYIPEITNKIKASKHKSSEIFKSNWLGDYFSKSCV